ncbi:hypothetical protein IWZ03DRAFT_410223 [Phyllosticta citriasiana]|uniref:DUF7924 domain-containing protein n=2 Tax=Phyllosticta citriasiana TaxID=595635 RepID=A0ABR1KWU6_9PEZI
MEAALNDSDRGPSSESVSLYQSLLQSDQTVPSPSAFDDPAFQIRLQQESESEIAAVIGDLLVPHAEHLFIMGEQDLEHMHDAVKEAWDIAISPFKLTPRPLYSVGFSYTAFTGAQLRLVEDLAFSEEYSLYRVTKDLHFPFFVADTTSGTDRSGPLAGGEELNAHSAMIAMRGIVELFTLAKREHEINNQVIVFSVVFDHASVTIYGHYAEISATGEAAKYYRHMIQDYKITTPGTQNRWISYKFVKAMYKEWAPLHLARIHSAIDALLEGSQPQAPESALGEAPKPSILAHINEDPQMSLATASEQNDDDALPENPTYVDCVRYWSKNHSWPSKYFESGQISSEDILRSLVRSDSDRKVRKHPRITGEWSLVLPERDIPELSYHPEYSMPLRSTGSSDARRHLVNSVTGHQFLARHSIQAKEGLTSSAAELCQKLRDTEQPVPCSISDQQFERIGVRNRDPSKTKVALNIGPKVAPRVETLFIDGDDSQEYLTESLDETWALCASIHKSYPPKPYYAAGFHYDYAFTKDQRDVLRALEPDAHGYVDECGYLFRVTFEMYFPFFVVEPSTSSCSRICRQFNVANALIAVRGVVELFRAAQRMREIHREILAFSAFYDPDLIFVYAHFADTLDGQPLRFYRHKLFETTYSDGGWAASYKFILNIYKVFAPMHHKRICSAIDALTRRSEGSSSEPVDGK